MPTDQELIKVVPSKRQLAYQATEFYAFFHFGMNTYTNREWGDGTEDPEISASVKSDGTPGKAWNSNNHHVKRNGILERIPPGFGAAHRRCKENPANWNGKSV